MKLYFVVLFLSTFSNLLYIQAQNLTFYQDIAPIVHKNCSPCHQPGKSGPFNLLTYKDVAAKAKLIASVTQSGYMPPWKADRTFRSFLNERGLTQEEKQKIKAWIDSGMKEGEKSKITEKKEVAKNRKADLELLMQKPFAVPGDNTEEFRFFNIPTNQAEEKYIQAIEFVPGNPKIVHHSRIMTDTTGKIRGIDGMSESDPRVKDFQRIPLTDEFMYGWVPGNYPIFFPPGMGKKLHKNADLIVNIHYAPSPVPAKDQSKIRFYFAKEKVEREVFTLTMNENYISNQPFVIPANSKTTFYMSSGLLPEDISLIAVLPHMHTLGKTFKAFAVTPEGEAINLIKIDDWDFNWQTTYQFKSLLHIPKNSIILAEATYDNTSDNPQNPYNPPREVGYGWNTKDEMMNLIIYYVSYKEGDEKMILNDKEYR